jgi:hypothetical protein
MPRFLEQPRLAQAWSRLNQDNCAPPRPRARQFVTEHFKLVLTTAKRGTISPVRHVRGS